MHEKLRSDLILKFIQTKSHILKWRRQFSIHCDDYTVLKGDIDGHFDYLVETGKLKIGDYEILKDILKNVNATAPTFIDKKSEEIKKALQNNQNGS